MRRGGMAGLSLTLLRLQVAGGEEERGKDSVGRRTRKSASLGG